MCHRDLFSTYSDQVPEVIFWCLADWMRESTVEEEGSWIETEIPFWARRSALPPPMEPAPIISTCALLDLFRKLKYEMVIIITCLCDFYSDCVCFGGKTDTVILLI